MAKRKLFLVRHGQTHYNRLGLIQGLADVPLSEEGETEAAGLKDRLTGQSFDVAYASELSRARRTAEIILDGRSLSIKIDARLNEIHQGEWSGKSARELFKAEERYRTWVARPFEAHPPGGETFQSVADRAASFLKAVEGERAIAVAHGGLIAVMRAIAGEAPLDQAWTLIPKNLQVVEIDL